MSVRTKVLGLVDVMMRVPPVMVMDEILKMEMGMHSWLYPDNDKPVAHWIRPRKRQRCHPARIRSPASRSSSDSARATPSPT
ncbi:GD17744 [Drosophila simulans]|uniref:GD17744 n=1 Tax=Drosophila simulans TaxID=7240 RepID=B4R046_DROSI|nr:GD17744 [Drosophila simulans]